MTSVEFRNEIKRMIDDGKCEADVNGCLTLTFKSVIMAMLNCSAVLNCDCINFFTDCEDDYISLYLKGRYIGFVYLEDVKCLCCI